MNGHTYNTDILQIEKILSLHGIEAPVPAQTIKNRRTRKKAGYLTILRTLGIYSAATALSVTFFFAGKKIIAALSVKTVIAGVSSAILTAGSTFAVYAYLTAHDTPVEKAIAPAAVTVTEPEKKAPAVLVHYTIGIRPIESESVDAGERRIIGNILMKEFTAINGSKYAAMSSNVADSQIGYALRTTVEKTGDNYIISAKVIDLKTLAVVFITKETYQSADESAGKLAVIVRKISESVK